MAPTSEPGVMLWSDQVRNLPSSADSWSALASARLAQSRRNPIRRLLWSTVAIVGTVATSPAAQGCCYLRLPNRGNQRKRCVRWPASWTDQLYHALRPASGASRALRPRLDSQFLITGITQTNGVRPKKEARYPWDDAQGVRSQERGKSSLSFLEVEGAGPPDVTEHDFKYSALSY